MEIVKGDPGAKPSRRDRAAATRRRVTEAAYARFASHGYAATTMEAIAASAAVAVQTVYFIFHTKAELLVAAMVLAGGAPGESATVMDRDWIRGAIEAPGGARRLALIVEHGNEIYRRLAPMFPAVRAAASVDAEVDVAWQRIVADRRSGMARMMGLMKERGELRPGLDVGFAADLLFGLHRAEVYLAFTVECGWAVERYKAWQYVVLVQQLLPPADARSALAPPWAAVADLSFTTELASLQRVGTANDPRGQTSE
jgi:AcrR family transcriptional regulator